MLNNFATNAHEFLYMMSIAFIFSYQKYNAQRKSLTEIFKITYLIENKSSY